MKLSSVSIIFPIFNEEKRILKSLKAIEAFLKKKFFNKIEVILINDGSLDKTLLLIKSYLKNSKNKKNFKLISLKHNKGKGYALATGVRHAKNNWLLTSDIDLSVSLNHLVIWEKKFLKKTSTVYFASRSHIHSKVKKRFFRFILGMLFQFICFFIFKLNISDTQCGFKLYKKNIAKKLFLNLIENGYIHDVEISYKCLKNNITITELPVTWVHKSYGKINIFLDPFKMFFQLIILRIKLF